MSILYITHDIASARYVADRLIVMYAGQIAETGPIEDVLATPRHPYTQLLLSAVPDPRAPLSVAAEPTAASRPRSSTRPPAAGSAGAARWPSTPARRSRRCWPSWSPDHDAACHVAQTGADGSEGVSS